MTTSVRLPPRVEQVLAAYCVETQRSKSEVIVELLEQRFRAEEGAASAYDRALEAGFIGCLDADDSAAQNYKQQVRAAIQAKHGQA